MASFAVPSAPTALSPASSGILAGLWSGGSSSIFTVGVDGAGGSGIAYRFDGSSWQSQAMGTSRVLTSVWGPNDSDLYATGESGTMLRFDGKTLFGTFGHLAMSFFCGPYIMLQLGWRQEHDGTLSISSALISALVAFGWAFITGLMVVGTYVAASG